MSTVIGGHSRPVRLSASAQLDQIDTFAAITGPVLTLERSPMQTVGFTQASHERIRLTLQSGADRSMVTKRIRPSSDWVALRTGDRCGREAVMLTEPALDAIWDAFACPYVAYAIADDDITLVMDDLTPHLFPDVREPLSEEHEDALLRAIATLHARFWSSPGESAVLTQPWLAQPQHYTSVLDACFAADQAARAVLPEVLRESVVRGWAVALARLPASVAAVMSQPSTELDWLWSDLPRTLLHGDVKVANFALLPDQRVAAFDFAMLGTGPSTIDLGWYLAVNASRLARSKEDVLEKYRTLLSKQLDSPVEDSLWKLLCRAGIVVGARMLLWSKALAAEADRPGAHAEFSWWVARLEGALE